MTRYFLRSSLSVTAFALVCAALSGESHRYWASRPVNAERWTCAKQPLIHVPHLKRKHAKEASWREAVFSDPHLNGVYIAEPPGERLSPRFHPDTRIYWIVFEGKIRFDIEGQKPIVATQGSMV